ncbi:hypothetical protein E2P81_ATG05259 [Venturia nashicola]|uniref:Uncharacterized protein n=1 Tax=Venturia nashicola TaxID=86259 RepID=A0A4Z1PG95_9PEZI|nr:hypothetical protein E6O75_ATG05388 [Venturia nashicola]TLD32283.1 hypothetical protein E2P81_ATG05259 [Venturia nashicola]
MPPPSSVPSTPSPRRFITTKPPKEKATPKPPSNLRFQSNPTPQRPEQSLWTRTSPAQFVTPNSKGSQQFNAAPNFAFAKPKRQDVPVPSPPKHRPAIIQPRQESIGDIIEDASPEDGRDNEDHVMTMDSMQTSLEEEVQDHTSKRPRLSTSEHATPRRFVFGNSASVCTPNTQQRHTASRPQFIMPPSQPAEQSEPLPEVFSPQRRKEKFIPGGMASTARQWIVEASQMNSHLYSRRSLAAAGPELTPVRVQETSGSVGGGMLLVKGKIDGRDVKLILPGQGKKRGSPNDHIKAGDVVGIGHVQWNMEVAGEVWIACVEWKSAQG